LIRYCTNCRKEFDFTIKSLEDLENLTCPECGAKVDKNSRAPAYDAVSKGSDKMENAIGSTFSFLARLNYIFYIAISVVAVIAYYFNMDKLLYTMTGISLGMFLIQLLTNSLTFRSGLIFLPIGAAAGYYLLKSPRGACFGIAIVFILRHLIRDILITLFLKFLQLVGAFEK